MSFGIVFFANWLCFDDDKSLRGLPDLSLGTLIRGRRRSEPIVGRGSDDCKWLMGRAYYQPIRQQQWIQSSRILGEV